MTGHSSNDPYEVLRFPCPQCLQRLKVRALDRGKATHCPNCGARFTVPWFSASKPSPPVSIPQPLTTHQPASPQPNAAAPCGCLVAMVLLVGVALGVWWMIRAREQPASTPVTPDQVANAPPPPVPQEVKGAADARPQVPEPKKNEPEKEKAGANNPAPAEAPKPRVSSVATPDTAAAKPNAPDNGKTSADNSKSVLSLRSLAKEFLESFENWRKAIVNPEQFLEPGYTPTEDQLIEGTQFYLTIFTVSFIFLAPLVFTYKGEAADKTKVAVNGAIGLMFTGILAMTWFFAFWLMGGKSTVSGTFVAYIYAAGPYLPLLTVSSLLVFTGLPERYRRAALNPATTQAAMNAAIQDNDTSKGPVMLGGCAAMGIMIWSMIVVFRCFSFVHDVSGWKLAGAIIASLILSAPVSALIKRISTLIQGTPGASESMSDVF